MSERMTYANYRIARDAYDATPNYVTAAAVLKWAQALLAISDDYMAYADEADDIIDEETSCH